MMTNETKTQPTRYYIRCCDCLAVAAIDEEVRGYHAISKLDTQPLVCGICGGLFENMGRVSLDKKKLMKEETLCACDGRCTNACGPSCDCQCGGVNHGTGKVIIVQRVVGSVPKATPVADAEKHLKQAEEYRAAVKEAKVRIKAKLQGLTGYWLRHESEGFETRLRLAKNMARHASRISTLSRIAL